MSQLRPHIIPVYPPDNHLIFEEWFAHNYNGCNTERELLPFFPTSYWVNNDYGNDKKAYAAAVYNLDKLDKGKKYFVICQYDDGCLIDFANIGLDVLEFHMSKTLGCQLPLLCMPHPYEYNSDKKYFASFIGSRTHVIRNGLERYVNKSGWYISYEPHKIEDYCKIISQSIFSLCPRGYGINSFRIAESMQYNAIPVYISDLFAIPFDVNFEEYGVLHKGEDISSLAIKLESIATADIIKKQDNIPEYYRSYYTYEGCFTHIIKELETEYRSRKQD